MEIGPGLSTFIWCATFLNIALRQFGFEKTGHKNLLTVCLMEPSLTKKKEEQQLYGILGLAKYEGEQLDLLRSASESESSRAVVDHAVGSYCVALGAVLGLRLGEVIGNIVDMGKLEADKRFKVTVLWGPAISVARLGGGSVVESFGNVRGYLHDEGPALEQGQAWDGGGAEGQQPLGLVQGQLGVGGGAEEQLPLGQVLDAESWVLVDGGSGGQEEGIQK